MTQEETNILFSVDNHDTQTYRQNNQRRYSNSIERVCPMDHDLDEFDTKNTHMGARDQRL